MLGTTTAIIHDKRIKRKDDKFAVKLRITHQFGRLLSPFLGRVRPRPFAANFFRDCIILSKILIYHEKFFGI